MKVWRGMLWPWHAEEVVKCIRKINFGLNSIYGSNLCCDWAQVLIWLSSLVEDLGITCFGPIIHGPANFFQVVYLYFSSICLIN